MKLQVIQHHITLSYHIYDFIYESVTQNMTWTIMKNVSENLCWCPFREDPTSPMQVKPNLFLDPNSCISSHFVFHYITQVMCLEGDLRDYGLVGVGSAHGEGHMSKNFTQMETYSSCYMWLKPSNGPFLAPKNKFTSWPTLAAWCHLGQLPKGLSWKGKCNQSHLVKLFPHLFKKQPILLPKQRLIWSFPPI